MSKTKRKFTIGYFMGLLILVLVVNVENFISLSNYYFEKNGVIEQFTTSQILMIGAEKSIKMILASIIMYTIWLFVKKKIKK